MNFVYNLKKLNNDNIKLILLVIFGIFCLIEIIDKTMLILVGVLLIVYSLYTRREYFDKDGNEFVGVGEPKYGLRGELLDVIPVGYPKPPDYHCTEKCPQ